jgi:hypothetical protein
VIFRDDTILVTERSRTLDAQPGRISISGEETLCFRRIGADGELEDYVDWTIEGVLDRAIREQVADGIEEIASAVQHRRIVSIAYEEPLSNHFLFSLVKLDLRPAEYEERIRRTRIAGFASDKGRLAFLSHDEGLRLLKEGTCYIRYLGDSGRSEISAGNLHVTSPYRLLRTLSVISAI